MYYPQSLCMFPAKFISADLASFFAIFKPHKWKIISDYYIK